MAMFRSVCQIPSLTRGLCACKGVDKGGGKKERVLNLKNMNQNIVKLQYAVRGPLLIRALDIKKELAKGTKKPFKSVIGANIGDAHAMGQKPNTFIRQVIAVCTWPELLDSCDIPDDVKLKAMFILDHCVGNTTGAYTHSAGILQIREHIAQFICRRDGYPSNVEDCSLCAGASTGIKAMLELFKRKGSPTGVMIPIPQYPMYSATIAEFGLIDVPYYLDEEKNWSLSVEELKRALDEGKKKCEIRIIVVINPGNPTGQVLPKKNIEDLIKFAHENKLVIFADEVYQYNTYGSHKFYSFKKVLCEMGEPYKSSQELASFMSISKCYMGECGLRGGWMEAVNMDPRVMQMFEKLNSTMASYTVPGQIVVDCVANAPREGQQSFELWSRERAAVLDSLEKRARMVFETFKAMEGFSCNELQGAMYAFPKIVLPPKAIEAAKQKKQPPDVFYCFALLEDTGICVVPGSGFGQKPGSWHFRTTILPQPEPLKEMLDIFKTFHTKFTKQYS